MQHSRVRSCVCVCSCVFLCVCVSVCVSLRSPPDPALTVGLQSRIPPHTHTPPHPRTRIRTCKQLRDLPVGRTTPYKVLDNYWPVFRSSAFGHFLFYTRPPDSKANKKIARLLIKIFKDMCLFSEACCQVWCSLFFIHSMADPFLSIFLGWAAVFSLEHICAHKSTTDFMMWTQILKKSHSLTGVLQ